MRIRMLSHPGVIGRSEFYRFASLTNAVSSGLLPAGRHLNVILVGEKKMALLNRKYKKRRGPAEILTFSYPDDNEFSERDSTLLGEIVLCWRSLCKGASYRSVSYELYMIRLVVHGIFHLLGYSHSNDVSAEEMEEAEMNCLLSFFEREDVEKLFV
ncbi:rRNA maturation RNase YbeY [bacterium]|nr:rRNA maturation RNase YbeY [bacterium]